MFVIKEASGANLMQNRENMVKIRIVLIIQ